MIRALIVDDERIKRNAIAALIDWDKLKIELIGKESNGKNAYEKIKSSPKIPDIIITDIKMPVMDGLELIEKIKSEYPNIIFIVLSGFDYFEYAKKAMQYGVKYYLLKPVSEEEISDALIKASKEVIYNIQLSELLNLKKLKEEQSKNYGEIVNKIIETIDAYIDDKNMSLKWIAENIIFMNEDYLSKLFQKETGQKFNSYLLTKKVNMAKELLIFDSNKKIYEIFDQLGFDTNSRYFSQVFKKYTGLTPSEYREHYV